MKHALWLIDPLGDCGPNELLLADDFNIDFWNDSVVLQNIREPVHVTTEDPPMKLEDILKAVHGGTMLHQGVRRTWLLLNKLFPGHRIPMKKAQECLDK